MEGGCNATWGLWGLARLPLPVLRAERGSPAKCKKNAWGQSRAFLSSLQSVAGVRGGGAPKLQCSG